MIDSTAGYQRWMRTAQYTVCDISIARTCSGVSYNSPGKSLTARAQSKQNC